MITHSSADKPGTGIVMFNLGGPRTLDDVGPFLGRLFADREIIHLPAHSVLAPLIVRMRTPKVRRCYAQIGGGSPLLHWTQRQGELMALRLDKLAPATGPHRPYIAFRYADPLSDDTLARMHADGIRRAVAFTQYPQYSCASTGSSLNELWRALDRQGLADAFEWSVIDRWYDHPAYLEACADAVRTGLEQFDDSVRDQVFLLFSAHSLPTRVINCGDPYPQQVGATVQGVMERLKLPNPYLLSYQSKVGPVAWQGPSTQHTVEMLGAKNVQNVLVIGITFTSDHIETLFELDIEVRKTATRAGVQNYHRAPALNDRPSFIEALAEVVAEHLEAKVPCSPQYLHRCPGCDNARCRQLPRASAGSSAHDGMGGSS